MASLQICSWQIKYNIANCSCQWDLNYESHAALCVALQLSVEMVGGHSGGDLVMGVPGHAVLVDLNSNQRWQWVEDSEANRSTSVVLYMWAIFPPPYSVVLADGPQAGKADKGPNERLLSHLQRQRRSGAHLITDKLDSRLVVGPYKSMLAFQIWQELQNWQVYGTEFKHIYVLQHFLYVPQPPHRSV